MRRRNFFAVAAAAAAACSSRSRAAPRRDPVLGYLYAGSLGNYRENVQAFWKGLAQLGYVEGRNVGIEYREAHNDVSRLPELVLDLVRREVSVIVVPGSGPAARAAKAGTATIPIIFGNAGDPVRAGLVASLNRPGGNVTGVSDFGNALLGKRIELIKLLVPSASRIGILVTRGYRGSEGDVESARASARALSLETSVSVVDDQRQIDAALAAWAVERADGVCFVPSPLIVSQRVQIVALAARYRLPAIYPFIQFPEVGGLMSYGTSLWDRSYQTGVYTGLVLNGANPAELPVQRLSRFELAINLSTARALGLTVPAQLLAITDQVIE